MTPQEKVRENRLRRMAARQGLVLKRSRRRDPKALDYGRYWLTEREGGKPVTHKDGVTADAVEAHLLGPSAWERLAAIGGRPEGEDS